MFFSHRIYPDNRAIPVRRRPPTLRRVVNRRRVCGGSNYRSATVLASLSKSRAVRSVRSRVYPRVKGTSIFALPYLAQANERKTIRTYSSVLRSNFRFIRASRNLLLDNNG